MYDFLVPILNFIRRQVGVRGDSASATGGLHAKVKDIKDYLYSYVSNYSNRWCVASDNLKVSADGEIQGNTTRRAFETMLGGTMRLKFEYKGSTTSYSTSAAVTVNGVSVATFSGNYSSYQSVSLDLLFPMNSEIIVSASIGNASERAYLRNVRIYYDLAASQSADVYNAV